MSRQAKGRQKRQQGVAAVEMTLVLPVLLLLMLATAEVGRMLYQYNTLTKAQRNGVRLLATQLNYGQQSTLSECPMLGGTLPDNLINRASNLIVYGSEVGAGEAVLPGLTTAGVGFCEVPALNEVQVHLEYDFTPMMFTQLPTFGGDPIDLEFTLDSSISMRVLGGG
ncbi:MAG: pilus assembly protein [Oceanospirillales bacterium]|uniref:TadE-like protein n=1 Tax=Marinobacterium halophilum TaxID=267374 RepID=A0A2P8F1A9_9GAMM|nr:TadE/TadG family type IV pilus assembly protein [Marinobacterium halophilum]MBR9829229.1 pilus assembly protein [Oceanospirillales bacterium]PSL15504.1 TadE-like protein [Marinobacterium halophilum]